MATSIKQIRIFISSPSDVSEDRMAALRVIDELNRSFCDRQGLILFPLTWEHNIYPAVGDYSQDVINQQIGDYDIFVGIMANRFGSPTQKAESGTEEEFNIAYENRKNRHIMFFFNNKPVNPYSLDLEQLAKVKSFKDKLPKQGVLYKEFSADFESIFRDCLTQCLMDNYIKKTKESSDDDKISPQMEQTKIDFDKYLSSYNPTYEKYRFINALAIPNSQFKLKRIYVAQTIEKEHRFGEDTEQEVKKIDQLPVELINKYKKILIKDTAGMGKSTIMKYMFIDLIDNRIKDVGIPIYIELNRLNKERTILKEIQEELKFLSLGLDNDSLIKMIQKGTFVFFLDGYDEISIADRDEVRDDIRNLIINAGTNNNFILTSRPEDTLASFGDFQSFKIQPLTEKEAHELLSKYDQDKQKKVSEELIKELQTGKYSSIDEYLENPLLVSLLYSAFNYKAEIPLKKHLFYRQVYDALYNTHKLAQGQKPHEKRSGLDIDDFNRVLRYVGYECLRKVGVQFDKDTILSVIQDAKDFCCNLQFGNSAFLQDLLISVPVFSKDGTAYKWAHKSLMEYFAARFIADDAKEKQVNILTAIYNSENLYRYIDMLDIYYDIDYKGFSKNIMLPLLNEFVKYHDERFPVESSVDKDLLEARIALLFPHCVVGITSYDYFNKKHMDRNKYHNLELSFFKENVTENDRWRATSYGYYDEFVMLGFKNNQKINTNHILSLLLTKHPELFHQYEIRPKTINRDLYKEDKFYRIDILTGDDDINHFCLINTLLTDTNHSSYANYFDYSSVKISIERITEIELSKKQEGLLPT